ncbi:hypothetical protein GGI25_001324 [Coemansia spiralis]|uniref:Mitochondrial inner membrane protease subunit 2 n=1 Tax=Coemansia spiralis TaxID=417178 RepID=A0A9W8GAQ7_9FUNG|nr:hypothetical protein GGI25_001324 [Coemansia spiralis]
MSGSSSAIRRLSRLQVAVRAIAAASVVVFVNDNIVSLQMITGRSMQPALNPDSNRLWRDIVLVDRYVQGHLSTRRLQRGDIVVFTSPFNHDRVVVKRIIALPHDCVIPRSDSHAFVRVPPGHCWVEGDESFHSNDSNTFGPLPMGLVKSRAIAPVWPPWRFAARLPGISDLTKKRVCWDESQSSASALVSTNQQTYDATAGQASEELSTEAGNNTATTTKNSNAQDNQPQLDSDNRAFYADVDINHSANRQSLAKSATQKIVMEATGTEISTRGRYYADPAEATPASPALHLHIEASTQEMLDGAITMVERMKSEDPTAALPKVLETAASTQQYAPPSTNSANSDYIDYRSRSSSGQRLQGKIYVEVEPERGFNVRAKLIGTGGENMKYIQNTTGTRVQVRGQGSGHQDMPSGSENLEPMHLLITAQSEEALKQACEYGNSLVDTVRAQYYEFKETGGRRHEHYRHNNQGHSYRRRHQNQHHHHQQQPYYQQIQPPNPQYSYSQYQQPYQNQLHQQERSASMQYEQQAPQASGDSASASYGDYSDYYTQYYQYYGTYPDYSNYYGQPPGSNSIQKSGAINLPDQQAYSNYHYQQQHGSTVSSMGDPDIESREGPETDVLQDGYHSVPPPSSYANGNNSNKKV